MGTVNNNIRFLQLTAKFFDWVVCLHDLKNCSLISLWCFSVELQLGSYIFLKAEESSGLYIDVGFQSLNVELFGLVVEFLVFDKKNSPQPLRLFFCVVLVNASLAMDSSPF